MRRRGTAAGIGRGGRRSSGGLDPVDFRDALPRAENCDHARVDAHAHLARVVVCEDEGDPVCGADAHGVGGGVDGARGGSLGGEVEGAKGGSEGGVGWVPGGCEVG